MTLLITSFNYLKLHDNVAQLFSMNQNVRIYSGEPSAQVAARHGYQLHVPDKANAKKTQPSTGATQAAPLGRGSNALMDQSFPASACSLGEESV
jgi:hypothetical protein